VFDHRLSIDDVHRTIVIRFHFIQRTGKAYIQLLDNGMCFLSRALISNDIEIVRFWCRGMVRWAKESVWNSTTMFWCRAALLWGTHLIIHALCISFPSCTPSYPADRSPWLNSNNVLYNICWILLLSWIVLDFNRENVHLLAKNYDTLSVVQL